MTSPAAESFEPAVKPPAALDGLDVVRQAAERRESAVRSVFVRNAAAFTAFDAIWDLGAPCVGATVVVSYMYFMGISNAVVQIVIIAAGLLGVIQVASGKICHGPGRRIINFWLWVASALPWFLCGLLGAAAGSALPKWAWLPAFLAAYAAATAAGALAGPAYGELLVDATPLRRRGLMSAIRIALAGPMGIAGAGLVAWLTGRWAKPMNFQMCFLVGPVVMMASCASMLFMRDHGESADVEAVRPSVRASARALLGKRKYCAYLLLYAVMTASAGFIALLIGYGKDVLGTRSEDTGTFAIAGAVGGIGVPLVALLGDRFGFRLVVLLGLLGLAASALIPVLLPASLGALLVSYACSCAGRSLTGFAGYLAIELFEDIKPAMLMAITAVLSMPLNAAVAPLGGWISDQYGPGGYHAVFIASAALSVLCALGFHLFIHEPRNARRPTVGLDSARP